MVSDRTCGTSYSRIVRHDPPHAGPSAAGGARAPARRAHLKRLVTACAVETVDVFTSRTHRRDTARHCMLMSARPSARALRRPGRHDPRRPLRRRCVTAPVRRHSLTTSAQFGWRIGLRHMIRAGASLAPHVRTRRREPSSCLPTSRQSSCPVLSGVRRAVLTLSRERRVSTLDTDSAASCGNPATRPCRRPPRCARAFARERHRWCRRGDRQHYACFT